MDLIILERKTNRSSFLVGERNYVNRALLCSEKNWKN